MFDKWKTTIAGLMVGVLLGWGAWTYTRQNAASVPNNAIVPSVPNPVAHLIGKPLPAWSFPASAWANTKTPVTLDSLKGNVVLVELFRINCSHCQESAPFMYAMQKNYIPQGLKIVGIQSPIQRNPDENNWSKVQNVFKNLWKLTYPLAYDNKSQYLQKLYNDKRDDMRWPTVLLLDRNGVVIYGHTGHSEEREQALYERIKQEMAKQE